jgi:uncharacterized protein YkwD
LDRAPSGAHAGLKPRSPRMAAVPGSCFALAVVLFCAGCATAPAPPAPPPPPDPKTQMAALETRIFDLIQDARHTIDPNAKALALDTELTGVARQRSQDMAAKNYVAHAGPDGQTAASLVMNEDSQFAGLLGENIAARYYSPAAGVNVDAFARAFVKTWLASPAHRENLSFPAYDRSGVGAAVNGKMVFVTQLFASDLGLMPDAQPQARTVTRVDLPKPAAIRPQPVP